MAVELIDVTEEFDGYDVETLLFDIYVPEIKRTVGRCEFRVESGRDLWYYGNIGYVIYPPYRGHNFAYHACIVLLNIIRNTKKGLHDVIITCNPDNDASRRTIEKLGGRYHSTLDIDTDHELFRLGESQKDVFIVKLYV